MKQLTLKLIKDNIPLFANKCLEVEVNEKIKNNNILLIYSVMHGIILVNGIQILPANNNGKIILHIKNNTESTIILNKNSIIANYLDLDLKKDIL